MINSTLQQRPFRGRLPFAPFAGEKIYMRRFKQHAGLPHDLLRWQDTVDAMLEGIQTDGDIFLMVDQSVVPAGQTHRRPGLHVDGRWQALRGQHEHVFWDDDEEDSGDQPVPARPTGIAQLQRRTGPCEGLLLATDVLGCRGFIGRVNGTPGLGGNCDHLERAGLTPVDLEPQYVWAGDARHMLHESLALLHDCQRTVVRLNVQGWKP